MKYGFIKVASAIPTVKVADCKFNAQQIDTQIAIADGKGVQIIVFPELCITGYSCADLFGQNLLLEEAEIALMQIMNNTRQMDIISIVGMPVVVNSTLMNCAITLQKGKILGVVPKTYLPDHCRTALVLISSRTYRKPHPSLWTERAFRSKLAIRYSRNMFWY